MRRTPKVPISVPRTLSINTGPKGHRCPGWPGSRLDRVAWHKSCAALSQRTAAHTKLTHVSYWSCFPGALRHVEPPCCCCHAPADGKRTHCGTLLQGRSGAGPRWLRAHLDNGNKYETMAPNQTVYAPQPPRLFSASPLQPGFFQPPSSPSANLTTRAQRLSSTPLPGLPHHRSPRQARPEALVRYHST